MNQMELQWLGVGVLIAIAIGVLARNFIGWIGGKSSGCAGCPKSTADAQKSGLTHNFVPIEDLHVIDEHSAISSRDTSET